MHWPQLERTDGDFFFFVIQLKALASIKVFSQSQILFSRFRTTQRDKTKTMSQPSLFIHYPTDTLLICTYLYPLLSVPHFCS